MAGNHLTINSIIRTLDDNTTQYIRQGFGVNERLSNHEVYRNTDANSLTPTEASRPAAFKLDINHIPLQLTCEFAFPVGQANYFVRGDGPEGFRIDSQTFAVTGNADGTASTFTTPVFGNQHLVVGSPFRVAGDWTFTLVAAANNTEIAASMNIRLEVYFFFGDTATPYAFNDHFIELIRLTIPSYGSVAGRTWAQVENDVVWNIVVNLWTLGGPGLFYDARRGIGGAAQHLNESNLDLETIFAGTKQYCNCYDLAALVKVACGSVGFRPSVTEPGLEVPVSQTNKSRSKVNYQAVDSPYRSLIADYLRGDRGAISIRDRYLVGARTNLVTVTPPFGLMTLGGPIFYGTCPRWIQLERTLVPIVSLSSKA